MPSAFAEARQAPYTRAYSSGSERGTAGAQPQYGRNYGAAAGGDHGGGPWGDSPPQYSVEDPHPDGAGRTSSTRGGRFGNVIVRV
jgi:hypothetical protein